MNTKQLKGYSTSSVTEQVTNSSTIHPLELPDDAVLTEEVAATEIYGVKPRTMRQWRYDGTGPKYVRISKNMIGYRVGALKDFIRSREYSSTAEESAGI